MTWLVWVLSALVIASGVLVCIWAVRHDVHSPSRALMGPKRQPDPVAEHYATRRRERAAAAADWERDFRRAQGLPEPATTTLSRGEAVVPVSRMLTTANRLMWPPTLAELNPARDVEYELARIKGRPPYELSALKPSVPHPKPARAINVIQD